jgi:hypothetical protein
MVGYGLKWCQSRVEEKGVRLPRVSGVVPPRMVFQLFLIFHINFVHGEEHQRCSFSYDKPNTDIAQTVQVQRIFVRRTPSASMLVWIFLNGGMMYYEQDALCVTG